MPNLLSAKKNLRKSEKRRRSGAVILEKIKKLIKSKTKDKKSLQSLIDKAAKEHIIHKNKAVRLKAKFLK